MEPRQGGGELETLRTVNPGSHLAATAVNSKISTDLPLGRDGGAAEWEEALRDTEGRAAAAKLCPETLEPPTPSSLNPQPLTVPRGARTALPRAQHHRVLIIYLWLLLSSCSSKCWGSRNCLCYRKVKLRTAGGTAPAGATAVSVVSGTHPCPPRGPARGLASRGTGPRSRLPCHSSTGSQGVRAEESCQGLPTRQRVFGSSGPKQDNRLYYPALN